MFTLEVGKRYVTRDGELTTPMRLDPKPIAGQSFTAEVGGVLRNWTPAGEWAPGYRMGLDLVVDFDDELRAGVRDALDAQVSSNFRDGVLK